MKLGQHARDRLPKLIPTGDVDDVLLTGKNRGKDLSLFQSVGLIVAGGPEHPLCFSFPFSNCGCPALAACARAGTMLRTLEIVSRRWSQTSTTSSIPRGIGP